MRILLVDDHHLVREGIRLILANLARDISFLEAESCAEAALQPGDSVDLVLLDLTLPGTSGRDTFRTLRNHFADAMLVVVSAEEDPTLIRQLISDGAAGYIPKSSTSEVLLRALELVIAGGTYLPPHVLDDVGERPEAGPAPSLDSLSNRQLAVLSRVLRGKMNKVIADELNIAEGTVKAHLSAAYKALGVSNRTEAVYIATRLGMVLGEET